MIASFCDGAGSTREFFFVFHTCLQLCKAGAASASEPGTDAQTYNARAYVLLLFAVVVVVGVRVGVGVGVGSRMGARCVTNLGGPRGTTGDYGRTRGTTGPDGRLLYFGCFACVFHGRCLCRIASVIVT